MSNRPLRAKKLPSRLQDSVRSSDATHDVIIDEFALVADDDDSDDEYRDRHNGSESEDIADGDTEDEEEDILDNPGEMDELRRGQQVSGSSTKAGPERAPQALPPKATKRRRVTIDNDNTNYVPSAASTSKETGVTKRKRGRPRSQSSQSLTFAPLSLSKTPVRRKSESERKNASWVRPNPHPGDRRDSDTIDEMIIFHETVGKGRQCTDELARQLIDVLEGKRCYVPPATPTKSRTEIVKSKYQNVIKNHKTRDKTVVPTADLEVVEPEQVLGHLFDYWRGFDKATLPALRREFSRCFVSVFEVCSAFECFGIR
jgi:hypothetical protein